MEFSFSKCDVITQFTEMFDFAKLYFLEEENLRLKEEALRFDFRLKIL